MFLIQNSSSLGRVSSGGGSSAGLACVPRACAASPTQLFHRLVHREMRVLDECYFRTQPHRLESPVGDDDDMALAPLESVAAMGPAEGAACNTSSCSAAAGGLRRLFTRDFRECVSGIASTTTTTSTTSSSSYEQTALYERDERRFVVCDCS